MRLLLALAALPLVACNGFADTPAASTARADGQREWNVSGFDKVDASGSTDITIRTGQAFSVRGEGDPDPVAARLARTDRVSAGRASTSSTCGY